MTHLSPTALEAAAKAIMARVGHYGTPSPMEIDRATAAITAYLAQREKEGWVMVPRTLTEDMAAAMECQFSTEAQWAAALAAVQNGGE